MSFPKGTATGTEEVKALMINRNVDDSHLTDFFKKAILSNPRWLLVFAA
jgi:hypothetical protein